MDAQHSQYPLPRGTHSIPNSQLDLRSDDDVDQALLNPPPIISEKNIWFYWHQGFSHMHGYTKRVTRTWHRRFSKAGWTVRILDRVPNSPSNVEKFLDINDPATFPVAFRDGRIGGDFSAQHNSDLVRFPLLIKYGGVYADVGMIQIGDLEALWEQTLGDPQSPWEVLSYSDPSKKAPWITNYFMATRKGNPYFTRCQRLLLKLWNADGGKVNTHGMHASPLLAGCSLLDNGITFTDAHGVFHDRQDSAELLTDYIIQGQVLTMVTTLRDPEDGWDGPKYSMEHIWCTDFMTGSQLINDLTAWDGNRAFELMSLRIPTEGETESPDQAKARDVVEQCLSRSFGFKLAHGIILQMIGPTLGSLWRANPGSDDVPGTYAHWLRHGTLYWCPDRLPEKMEWRALEPVRVGKLLGD